MPFLPRPAVAAGLVAGLALASAAAQAAPPQYHVQEIVGPNGGFGVSAGAVNNAGRVVGVARATPGGPLMPAVWENGVTTFLPVPDGAVGTAQIAINELGEIVSNAVAGDGRNIPLYYDAAGTFHDLSGTIDYTSTINDLSQIASYVGQTNFTAVVVRVSNGAIVDGPTPVFDNLPAGVDPASVRVWDINNQGMVGGLYHHPTQDFRGFTSRPDGSGGYAAVPIDVSLSEVWALNESGDAFGRAFVSGGDDEGVQAVRFDLDGDGNLVALDPYGYPPNVVGGTFRQGRLEGVNEAGVAVGYAQGIVGGDLIITGAIYIDGVAYDFDDLLATPGYLRVGRAWDINDAGQILAEVIRSDGTVVSALLTPVPEPSAALAALAGLGLAALRRRRR